MYPIFESKEDYEDIDTMEEFDTVGRGFNEQTGDLVDFHCGLSWMGEIENEQKKEQARHARGHDQNEMGPRCRAMRMQIFLKVLVVGI